MDVPLPLTSLSQNHLEGSLAEVSVDELLDKCRSSLLTGLVKIHALGDVAVIELRAGGIEQARFLGLDGDAALARLRGLGEGMYEVVQRLPDLGGALGGAAELRGQVDRVPLIEIMRHCEQHALSCTITIVCEFDRGEIVYRAGELVEVTFNGKRDDDKIVEMLRFPGARYRVQAPPLAIDVAGRPPRLRLPTEPIVVDHVQAALAGAGAGARRATTQLPGVGAAPEPPPALTVPFATASLVARLDEVTRSASAGTDAPSGTEPPAGSAAPPPAGAPTSSTAPRRQSSDGVLAPLKSLVRSSVRRARAARNKVVDHLTAHGWID